MQKFYKKHEERIDVDMSFQVSPSSSSDSGYDSNLYDNPVIWQLVFKTAEGYSQLDKTEPGSDENHVQANGLTVQINR